MFKSSELPSYRATFSLIIFLMFFAFTVTASSFDMFTPCDTAFCPEIQWETTPDTLTFEDTHTLRIRTNRIYNENVMIQIYDILGRSAYQTSLSINGNEIQINNLLFDPGFYYIYLQSNEHTEVYKLIKQ